LVDGKRSARSASTTPSISTAAGWLIDFGEGRVEALPLPDGAVDVALSSTVFEEGDAELMLDEILGAIDMSFWVNLPLDPALKATVDAPNVIGGVAPKGVADASLWRRLTALELTGLKWFPSWSRWYGVRAHPALPAADPRRTDAGGGRNMPSGRRGSRVQRHLFHRPALLLRRRHPARLTRQWRTVAGVKCPDERLDCAGSGYSRDRHRWGKVGLESR
jgi:hypothetical protein